MTGSRIVSVGHFQPEQVLTNEDLTALVDTSDEWIRSRVGVRERRKAPADMSVTDMAVGAAEHALAGLAEDEIAGIDLVCLATCTAWDRSPNISAQVADRLGLTAPATIDVSVACSGFAHALAVADQAVQAGSATTALVIGVEKLTDFTDWSDRSTCVLVGDGAGAMLLRATDTATGPEASGVRPVVWGSVPSMSSAVRIMGRDPKFAQEGQSVFRWTTTNLPKIARRICERGGVTPEELGGVVLHQANLRIIKPVVRDLGVGPDTVIATDVELSGNTSAGSIPMAFSKLVHEGRLASGSPVLLLGFGGGLSYAGQIVLAP